MAAAKLARSVFEPAANSPLVAEHGLVNRWIEQALEAAGRRWYETVDLKSVAAGRAIASAKPDEARRIVLAALEQVLDFDAKAEAIRATGKTESERMNAHLLPGWQPVWARRQQTAALLFALLRRALPFNQGDLLRLLDWCGNDTLSVYHTPLSSIVRAVDRYLNRGGELTSELRDRMSSVAAAMRASHDKDVAKLATPLEQLIPTAEPVEVVTSSVEARPEPTPAPVGNPLVLTRLKRELTLAIELPNQPTVETLAPDRFPMRSDSPLSAEHRLLSEIYEEFVGTRDYFRPRLTGSKHGTAIAKMEGRQRGRLLLAAAERADNAWSASNDAEPAVWQSRYSVGPIAGGLAGMGVALDWPHIFDYLLFVATRVPAHARGEHNGAVEYCLSEIEDQLATSQLSDGDRYVLHLLRASTIRGPLFNRLPEDVLRLNRLVGDCAAFFLVPGEAWSDALNCDLAKLPSEGQNAWIALLRHLWTASSSRPSGKWSKTAAGHIEIIGKEEVRAALERWLPLVAKGQTVPRAGAYAGDTRGIADTIHEENALVLRGMLWIAPMLDAPGATARIIGTVASSAYKKVPGVGPRAVKVGNAAVYALSQIASEEAVGQLAMLKVRVKFGTAQKEIEKAFNSAAEALGLPQDEIEEMGVPSYGLTEVGKRTEQLGENIAEIVITGTTSAELRFIKPDGKPLKSVPAAVKRDHADDLKELKAAAKDIAKMLPAQRDRIDQLFLQQKTWAYATWRERYLDHPLIGTLARRLIWLIDDGRAQRPAIWLDGTLVNEHGKPVSFNEDAATVSLWHPITREQDEILAWRRLLEERQIRQPFKQAHREVYLLTDAERNTATYSNRFAAHILRQHQFNALCGVRGWKNKLRLMVDDEYPPAHRDLPAWGLRAEYWIEGIGDEYGADTTESGSFLRIATDQVRFYRIEAATNTAHAGGGRYGMRAGDVQVNHPLPLTEIPPLVLSEIMRDVDLFVGVASVGNDPTWSDGGPEGRFRDYWQSYSFGELSGTAASRRDTLERLIPRLKIAAQCSLSDRFLIVRGTKRTYKIHLGSGNILMEPNDEYLCIVPSSRDETAGAAGLGKVFLPFEGDRTLSIILSKAFLLAADDKITDRSILSQIKGR